ncbi:hypothetical protein [Azonexus hydrophilus]|jgi:hypothetical protein|uniref:DUF3077 domain-containing protein n=1 Tax=Azonexus hydrophilus TaxID=418702 RepID=A0ABZ2XBX0_9RHOO
MAKQNTLGAGELQSHTGFIGSSGEAALILQAIAYAADVADEDCGDVQKSSNWLLLIGAAANHAHYLLTGMSVAEVRT